MAKSTRSRARSSQTGGHSYNFVDTPPDRLVCSICHLPSRDPYLTTCCGHGFCKSCLDYSKKSSLVCPVCRKKKIVAFINKQADREIKSLRVMCTNKERGCEWQGELNDIINHLGNSNGCQFEDVKCSNNCGKMLQRRYLTSHVETECPCHKVDCQYCRITGKHQFIEGKHKEQCPKLPLPCPNKCTDYPCGHKRHTDSYAREMIKYIPREDMEAHKEECPLQEVECSYKCGKVLQRQYVTSHVETECPCRMVDCQYCHITGEHQFIEGEHKEQCPKLPLPCPNKCGIGSVLGEDMEAHRKECPLEMVQCEYHNVGCEERMMRKRKKQHEEEKMEDHLFLTKRSLTQELAETKSQLANALHVINTIKQSFGLPSNLGGSESELSITQLQVQLNVMSNLIESGDQICPVIVKIAGFSEKKNNLMKWYSNPFYSHYKGYKICLCLYPDGCFEAKSTHLSLFLYLMKGPHDDELTWPLRGKFEVKLLNQISDCEHHVSQVKFVEKNRVTHYTRATFGWEKYRFISNEGFHKVTPTCQYLKDNCIFFQVSKL